MADNDSLVVTSKSGVRTVEPRKILTSPAGKEGIRQARDLFQRMSRRESTDTATGSGANKQKR